MEENVNSNGKDKLSFNMAVDYNSKIAEYLHEAETLWFKGNLKDSLWAIKKVWHKISPFLEKKEDEDIEKAFDKLQKKLFSIKNNNERWVVSSNIEKVIRFLGKKLNELGLLIPTSEDPRFLFRKK